MEVVGAAQYDDNYCFPEPSSPRSSVDESIESGLEVVLPDDILPPRVSVRSSLSSELLTLSVSPQWSSDLPMVQRAISFKVERELVRGIPLVVTLRNFGKLWSTSPLELDLESQTKLWDMSQPVDKFDVFFSHTWRTRGSRKVLSLLFQHGWRTLLIHSLCCASVVCILSAMGLLPTTPLTWPVHVLGFKAMCPFSPWTHLTGTLVLHISMFILPYCSRASYSPICFLDVVSIHQTDRRMKQRGVYGLGGFLGISKEMHVLWSPPYLTRSSAADRRYRSSYEKLLVVLNLTNSIFLGLSVSKPSSGVGYQSPRDTSKECRASW